MSEQPESKPSSEPSGQHVNYEIPPEGSLGLLALGHIGLKLWREKRKEVFQARMAENQKLKQDKNKTDE